MSTQEKKRVPIRVTKSPDYKVFYATGIFGGLSPREGRMIFHLDRLVPRMKEEPLGGMETGEVERELQVEVHLSMATFLDMYVWIKGHVERMEKKGILKLEEKEAPAGEEVSQ